MAKEYISKDDALEAITQADLQARMCFVAGDAKQKIRAIPAADVTPVLRGQWEEDSGENWRCSECRCYANLDGDEYVLRGKNRVDRSRYCPNCGAKMDKEAER